MLLGPILNEMNPVSFNSSFQTKLFSISIFDLPMLLTVMFLSFVYLIPFGED
jgi:hypothetical protein